MTHLNSADSMRLGDSAVNRLYLGSNKVWPTPKLVPAKFESYSLANSGNEVPVTMSQPTGVSAGDLVVAFVNTSANVSWTGPTNIPFTGPFAAVNGGAVFYRLWTGSESTQSLSFRSSAMFLVTHRGMLVRISGADLSNPVQAIAASSKEATIRSPSVTAAQDKSLLFSGIIDAGSATPLPTPPADLTSRFASTQVTARAGADKVVAPGATGDKVWTGTPGGAGTYAASVLINPRLV